MSVANYGDEEKENKNGKQGEDDRLDQFISCWMKTKNPDEEQEVIKLFHYWKWIST